MTSFQITLKPTRRTAGRFIAHVRREIQRALAEEKKRAGLTQSDIAKAIGVHRSVINRELRGKADMTLGRVAELASALGHDPIFFLQKQLARAGSNQPTSPLPPRFSAVSTTDQPLAIAPLPQQPQLETKVAA